MAKELFESRAFMVFVSCAENCVQSKSEMLVPDIGMVHVHQTSFVRFERKDTLMPDNVPLLRAVSDRMKNEALYLPGLTLAVKISATISAKSPRWKSVDVKELEQHVASESQG